MTHTHSNVVIIFNGVGSVGKSSVARALQDISSRPLLHVSMDSFLDMLPAKLWNNADGIMFKSTQVNDERIVNVHVGEVGKALLSGFRQSVAALAQHGNNLIVDDVMLGNEMAEYKELLRSFQTYFVGFFAPLDVIAARELKRGDREIGIARAQYQIIKPNKGYDLEVDTSKHSPSEIAKLICRTFNLDVLPT